MTRYELGQRSGETAGEDPGGDGGGAGKNANTKLAAKGERASRPGNNSSATLKAARSRAKPAGLRYRTNLVPRRNATSPIRTAALCRSERKAICKPITHRQPSTQTRCIVRTNSRSAAAIQAESSPSSRPSRTISAASQSRPVQTGLWLLQRSQSRSARGAWYGRAMTALDAPSTRQRQTEKSSTLTQLMHKKIDDGGFETPYRLRKQIVKPVSDR